MGHQKAVSCPQREGAVQRSKEAGPAMEKAGQYTGDLKQFLKDYNYQPTLTPQLDGLGGADLTPELLDQIVLRKLNRYVSPDSALLAKLNQLKALRMGEHHKGELVLLDLLATHGVDLIGWVNLPCWPPAIPT